MSIVARGVNNSKPVQSDNMHEHHTDSKLEQQVVQLELRINKAVAPSKLRKPSPTKRRSCSRTPTPLTPLGADKENLQLGPRSPTMQELEQVAAVLDRTLNEHSARIKELRGASSVHPSSTASVLMSSCRVPRRGRGGHPTGGAPKLHLAN